MEISNEMCDALNGQIGEELFSEYLYLSMSAWFESENLPGFANWMRVQAGEEHEHAMRFYKYIVERQGKVSLEAIKKPKGEWKSPLEAFEEAYKHENHITKCISGLMDQAIDSKDHATASMLKWFVDEQVEEEASADEIVKKLEMIRDSKQGLLMLDHQMAARKRG